MGSRSVRNAADAEMKADVEVLIAQKKSCQERQPKIDSCRSRLKDDGASVGDSIGPIHDNTREHQTILHSKSRRRPRVCGS